MDEASVFTESQTPPQPLTEGMGNLKARLFKARESLVTKSPFLGALVLRMPVLVTEDERLGTACVDGRGICTFSKSFLEALELPALRAVLLHEALHLALDAFPRCGSRKALRWNLAHDFAINQLIDESEFYDGFLSIPEAFKPLLDPQFRGLPAELIYDRLPADLGDLGLGDGACIRDAVEHMSRGEKVALGQAVGRGMDPEALDESTRQQAWEALRRIPERIRGEMPSTMEACDEATRDRLLALFRIMGPGPGDLWFDVWGSLTEAERDALRDNWRKHLLEAAEQAMSGDRSPGSLPGWAQKLLGPLLSPQIPWQVKLVQKLHGRLCGRRRTFSRPGRRSAALGCVLPGPMHDRAPVGVFVDVSGSIGPEELGAFLGELGGILQGAGAPVRLITWDATVQEDLVLEHPEDLMASIRSKDLQLQGGGGTDPRCVIEYLGTPEGLGQTPLTFGILLTDGYVFWPRADAWPFDILVVSTGVLPEPKFGYDALSIETRTETE